MRELRAEGIDADVTNEDVRLAEVTHGKLHVCHVSTAGSVEILRWAKGRGVDVTAEVTPHHLFLTDEHVRSYDPRFVFGWPNHKVAVMGPTQLAGVMSIISRAAAEARGTEFDEEADQNRRTAIEAQIGFEEQAYFSTARVRDDGLFDPRDTRTVLGIGLSAVHSGPVEGTSEFGVFRM